MKRTLVETSKSHPKSTRGGSDNLCKRLAEEYPAQFARWLFGAGGKVKVEKTELSREPIRADAVIFSRDERETLHAEFQTTAKSKIPMPLRLLDYYVGFKRQNPDRRVRQAVVILKPTNEPIPDRYEDELTLHRYGVVKLWEQDPAAFLEHEGLLPLATLCRAESGEKLLGHVAARINHIKDRKRRSETLNWSRMMAGLRYDKGLITAILKESDMLEESVIYQDIFRKGKRQGVRQGAEQEVRKVATRQLERRFGKLSRTAQREIGQLGVERLEALCDALLDFKSKDDLARWLKHG